MLGTYKFQCIKVLVLWLTCTSKPVPRHCSVAVKIVNAEWLEFHCVFSFKNSELCFSALCLLELWTVFHLLRSNNTAFSGRASVCSANDPEAFKRNGSGASLKLDLWSIFGRKAKRPHQQNYYCMHEQTFSGALLFTKTAGVEKIPGPLFVFGRISGWSLRVRGLLFLKF